MIINCDISYEEKKLEILILVGVCDLVLGLRVFFLRKWCLSLDVKISMN